MTIEEITQTYWQKIYRLCKGYVNDHQWAEDITQETFITVWKQLPKFRNESSIGTWIFRIASNHCLRQIERQKRMPNAEFPPEIAAPPTIDNEPKIDFLYQCISELPEIERLIISLELEEVNQAEIASIVGISAGNVRVKIHRIKERLTKRFENYER